MNKLKSLNKEYLENLLHDLQTPLIGLKYAYEQEMELQKTLNAYMHYQKKLVQMIDEIELHSPRSHLLSLHALIDQVIQLIHPQLSRKKIDCIVKISDDFPRLIVTDEARVYRIILELLNNAVKYTHQGVIDFSVFIQSRQLTLEIKDTGVGIDTELQSLIFSRYTQCQNDADGLGLGLNIVSALMDDLSGEILFQSLRGQGTCVNCKIPVMF